MATIVVYKSQSKVGSSGKSVNKRVREREHNFMKYWRVVRYWAKRKYNISTEDIEVILYLYDIDLFTRKQYTQFEGLLAWDKKRFNRFLEAGTVVEWRPSDNKRQAKLYCLSVGAKRMCSSIYKKLLLEERIPETPKKNPIFKGSNYADKVYRTAIRTMNEARDQKIKDEREAKM